MSDQEAKCEWNGKERRSVTSCPCAHVLDIKNEMLACKADVDKDISSITDTVHRLSHEVHGLRADVHRMTESVGSMKSSLESIAGTLSKLADLPEAWTALKGFFRVMNWARDNLIPVATVMAVAIGAVWLALKAAGVV